ncbi:hypothetical protein ASG25_21790 [Rhizobium sp. Leaf384]|uniref:phage tail length tape measure family protein n=1 Tax=Rhizobium sp. Leaf384 TaxID=1736358 RepID=UPI000713CFD5|nr:phage tail length tape measure family protein [Rhizobium sp. Leaf384]KQS79824.1 hypothetical protein ASG25_21790 [Rhizobium sp. Leaf384]
MAMELRSLRVAADLDANGYAAGANRKVAADRAMSESGRQAAQAMEAVGTTAASTNTKISSAADGIERIKRQFVTGYAAQADFDRGLKTVGAGLDKGRLSAEQASVAVENLSRKYGVAADASHSVAKGNAALSQAIAEANGRITAQSAAVDDLAQSYQRMAAEARLAQAAEQAASQAQASINRTLGVGAAAGSRASDSASVFAEELARREEMERLRATQTGSAFASDLNARLGVNGNGTSARGSAAVFEEAAREADRFAQKATALRAQLDPVGASQARLNSELAEYAMLADRAEISTTELAQAQTMARARHEQYVASLDRNPVNDNKPNHTATNAMFQFQDIAMTAAGGMSPAMIGLQQGSQLAGGFAGMGMKEAITTTGAALVSLVSPLSIATIGLTAGAAAAIQFGIGLATSEEDAKKLDTVLQNHGNVLKALEERYGSLIAKAKGFSMQGVNALNFQAGADIRGLRNSTKVTGDEFFDEVGTLTRGGYVAKSEMFGQNFSAFNDAITKLRNGVKAGKPDFEAFYDSLYKTAALKPEYAKQADEIAKLVAPLQAAAQALAEMERAQRALQNAGSRNYGDVGAAFAADQAFRQLSMQRSAELEAAEMRARTPAEHAAVARQREENTYNPIESVPTRTMRIQLAETQALTRAEYELKEAQSQRIRQYDADMAAMRAKSPADKEAAARAQAAVQIVDGEDAAARQSRVAMAGTQARVQAEYQLSEAQQERVRSLQEGIRQQEMEIAVIGQTVGKTAELQTQYSLLSQLRSEAARNGITSEAEFQRVFGQEVELINQAAAAHGRLAEARARAQLSNDLQFERDQLYRSSEDQQIASRQRGAGLSVDLSSQEALMMRQNMQIAALRDGITGFFTDFRDGLEQGDSIGEAFGNALLNGLMKVTNWITDSLIDSFVSSIIGKPGSGSTAGTGIFSLIGTAAPVAGAAASTASAGAGIANTVAAAANDNAVRSAAGSALSFVGNYKSGVDAKLTDILNTAAQRFPGFKVDAMSGFRPGDPRFHGQGLATDVKITDLASGKMLGNYQDASSFRTYEQFAQTARGVQMEKYPELAQDLRWGGYFSGGKGKYGAADTMHFDLAGRRVGMGGGSWEGGLNSSQRALWPGAQSEGMDTATAAVNKLAAGSQNAAQSAGGLASANNVAAEGMTNLGGGLSKFGQALAAAQSGGGGLLSALTSLTGIGQSIFNSSAQFSGAISGGVWTGISGGGFGLYADGGFTGHGGRNQPAGVVHKGEIVWSQSDIARAGGIGAVEGMRLGWRGYADGGLVAGPHRRSTIRQAANNHGGSGSSGRIKVDVGVSVDDQGNLKAYVKNVAQEEGQRAASEAVDENNRHIPYMIEEHGRNPRKRMAG